MNLEVDPKEDERSILLGTPKKKSRSVCCTAPVQHVKPITSSISKPIHMIIGCF